MNPFNLATEVLNQTKRLLVLTGAGISVSAGIPCFTGSGSDPSSSKLSLSERRAIIEKASPTEAHLILAKWEKIFPEFLLVTQNIDGLHKRAGSEQLVELHGNIFDDTVIDFDMPVNTEKATAFALRADTCLIIGSSLQVFPAANLPYFSAYNGAAIIEINVDGPVMHSSIALTAPATAVMRKLDKQLELEPR